VTLDSLEFANARLAAIVESSDDAIVSKTLDGTITSWNAAAKRLYGYTQGEAIGKNVSIIVPPGRPNELADILTMVGTGECLSSFHTTRLRKDGSEIPVSLTVSPIKDACGQITGASTIARDIAQQIRDDDELKRSHQALAERNEELQQFAYVASHDLREPLRTVRSFCELFRENYQGQLDEQADRWIDFMVDGVSRMHNLIDDLLTYSRLESHAKPTVSTDLNKILVNVLKDMKVSLGENAAEITCDTLPTLQVEPTQTAQLFQNLIDNSVKYRRDESLRIHVGAKQTGGHWTFSVSDNGIGIEPEFHDKVFEMFKRLHPRDKYSGTGIGLAVCRKIVHRHGGRMWLESEAGDGTTFYFSIRESE